MKYFVTLLVIAGFAGMAVFGVFLMGHAMTGHMDCAASAVTGSACPTNQIAFVAHHMAAFQLFSSVAAPAVSASFLVFIFLTALALLQFFGKSPHSPPNHVRYGFRAATGRLRFYSRKFVQWLAFFEHSPSF